MKGVSPVVATVLLIAIAVIAAVGVWFFVQNMQNKEQPSAMIAFTIEKCSGTALQVRNLAATAIPTTAYTVYLKDGTAANMTATFSVSAGAGTVGTGTLLNTTTGAPVTSGKSYYVRGSGIADTAFTC